jgi:transcriptional regulator with XRE-family HTH domain
MRTHKWSKLAAQVEARPGYQERMRELRRQSLAEGTAYEQTMAQIRKARDASQAELAKSLDVSQVQVSRIENQTDLYLATLERCLAGVGAELELTAVFRDGTRVLLTREELSGRVVETEPIEEETLEAALAE